jgi:hypothetical protein
MRQLDYIAHHGILGQKWGVRRFQNKDGTLTAEGKNRYGKDEASARKFVYDNGVSMFTNRRKYEWGYESTDDGKKMMSKIDELAGKAADAYDAGNNKAGDKYTNELDKLTDEYDINVGKYVSQKMMDAYGDNIAKVEDNTYKEVEKMVFDKYGENDPYWVDDMMQDVDLYKETLRKKH